MAEESPQPAGEARPASGDAEEAKPEAQSSPHSEGAKTRRTTIVVALIGTATAIVVALIALYGSRQPPPQPSKPRFIIVNSLTNPTRPVVVQAANQHAKRQGPLHIRFDGHDFPYAGVPDADPAVFSWTVTLATMLYAFPDMLQDGPHTLQVSFPGEIWSDETQITLTSKPWPTIVEIRSPQDNSQDHTIQGVINPQS